MKKRHVVWSIAVAALLVATMSFPVWAQVGDRIKIGVLGPMKYVQGRSHWNGALMAAEQINAKGPVRLGFDFTNCLSKFVDRETAASENAESTGFGHSHDQFHRSACFLAHQCRAHAGAQDGIIDAQHVT